MLKYTAVTEFKGVITIKTFKTEKYFFSNENNYYFCRRILADKTAKDDEKIRVLRTYCDVTN